jgi:hypothetical protein
MKYRGVDLEPTPESADVFTDGHHWMREFYIEDGAMIPSYPAYILRTLRPGSSPGVHLIFVTDRDQMTPDQFNQSCLQLAARLDAKRICAL